MSRWQILYLLGIDIVYRRAEGEEQDGVVCFFGKDKTRHVAEISVSVLEEAERNLSCLHGTRVSVRRLS